MRLPYLIAACVILGSISTGAQAQFLDRLLDRAERAAKGEIEAKVDRETRKATRCALGGDICITSARDRGEEVEIIRDPASAAPRAPIRNGEVHFPHGAISYADRVVSYSPSTSDVPPRALRDRNNILGAPDYVSDDDCNTRGNCSLVALGPGGRIELRFTDNVLSGSGDDQADLWIFATSSGAKVSVEISVDGEEWLSVGEVRGSGGVDLDGYGLGPYTAFHYVRLTDMPRQGGRDDTAGASLDAVGAISTRGASQ